jgi:hypothetical protein
MQDTLRVGKMVSLRGPKKNARLCGLFNILVCFVMSPAW